MLNTAILRALLFTPAGRRQNGDWLWGIPIIYWGAPGIGKSAIVGQVARVCGLKIFVIIASIREPADFLGLPMPMDGKLVYMAPNWAQEAADCDMAVVFLDEISTCAPSTQAALLRCVLDRVVGDLELPGGVRFIAAANPTAMAAGGYDIAGPLANRFLHSELGDPSVAGWRDYMIGGGGDSNGDDVLDPEAEQKRVLKRWREDYAWARGLWSAFAGKHPGLLMSMPKQGDPSLSRAWGSPRTFEMAARVTAGGKAHGLDEQDRDYMIAMTVGEAIAAEFAAFRSDVVMPDLVRWLDGKEDWTPDPTRPDITNAVFDGAAALIKPKGENKKADEVRKQRANSLWGKMKPLVETTPDVAVTAGITLVNAGFSHGVEATYVMGKLRPIVEASGMLKV